MHELGIAQSVIEAAEETLRLHPGARLAKVCVRIGELAGVDRESLSFCFDVLIRESPHAGASLEIDWRPLIHRCPACQREFPVADWNTRCPACGADDTHFVSGRELEVAYLELEEP